MIVANASGQVGVYGTVTSSLALNSGTITTIAAGTQNTLGTVGTILGIGGTVAVTGASAGTVVEVNKGTITTGSIANIGFIHEIGTMPTISIGESTGGTLDLLTTVSNLTIGSVVMTVGTVTQGSLTNIGVIHNAGTIASLPQISIGTIPQMSVGTLPTLNLTTGTITTGSLTNIAFIHEIGTMPAISIGESTGGTLDLVTTVSNLTTGSVVMTVGTVTQGSLTNLGVIHNAGTVAALQDLPGGTVDLLSTVTTVSNLTIGSVRITLGSVGGLAAPAA